MVGFASLASLIVYTLPVASVILSPFIAVLCEIPEDLEAMEPGVVKPSTERAALWMERKYVEVTGDDPWSQAGDDLS